MKADMLQYVSHLLINDKMPENMQQRISASNSSGGADIYSWHAMAYNMP